MFIVEL